MITKSIGSASMSHLLEVVTKVIQELIDIHFRAVSIVFALFLILIDHTKTHKFVLFGISLVDSTCFEVVDGCSPSITVLDSLASESYISLTSLFLFKCFVH